MRRKAIVLVLLLASSGLVAAETIVYEAYSLDSHGTRTLIAKGSREYVPDKDIDILAPCCPAAPRYQRLQLFGNYYLLVPSDASIASTGFGVVVDERGNPNAFSWNWFRRDQIGWGLAWDASPQPQEILFAGGMTDGRIRVRTIQAGGTVELASATFLDDVVLQFTDDMRRASGAYSHEFVIQKGSVFRASGAKPVAKHPRGKKRVGMGV